MPPQSSNTPDPISAQALSTIAEPAPAPQVVAVTVDEQRSLDLALAEQQLNELIEARDQRRKYAKRIFNLVCGWLLLVGYVVVSQGLGHDMRGYKFGLSDSVMIALITTTTATVIGVLAIVLNHLFPKRT